MKAILIVFLLLLMALACTMANPPRNLPPSASPDYTARAEWLTETASSSIFSEDEIRQTQAAALETMTVISVNYQSTQISKTETATAITPFYPLTQAAYQTQGAEGAKTAEALGIDIFSLTATSLVATATANANITHIPITLTPSISIQWPVISFFYEESLEGDWQHNPRIEEVRRIRVLCDACLIQLWPSHQINIQAFDATLKSEDLYLILEDVLSRLPDYPPFNPDIYQTIDILNHDLMGATYYEAFSYSEALAAYELGLNGADLAEALGIAAP
jgi:hypothetical protein